MRRYSVILLVVGWHHLEHEAKRGWASCLLRFLTGWQLQGDYIAEMVTGWLEAVVVCFVLITRQMEAVILIRPCHFKHRHCVMVGIAWSSQSPWQPTIAADDTLHYKQSIACSTVYLPISAIALVANSCRPPSLCSWLADEQCHKFIDLPFSYICWW